MFVRKTLLAICSVWILCSFHPLFALIVPQELPSLLSVVYSNIPPIKKGTDSRLGFGFRLGEHADFQVLVELGPQKETRPIGNKDGESSFNKRHINEADRNALIRQQLRKQLKHQQELTSTERNAGSWLESWSQDMNALKKKPSSKSKSKQQNSKKHQKGELNFAPTLPTALPSKSLEQLQLLYKMATTPAVDETRARGSRMFADPKALIERLKGKEEITRELMDVSLEQGE